ncbi:MAG: hypothetical protein MI864_16180 [Pseudomonadales bacterium]|nr:hypothetical protein [Pseudomonadales bacterium]
MGYKPAEAKKAIAAVANEGLSVEQIIRDALKGMVKG